MFEISWSELLILAVVVLIFVGPKDMPVFFNTLGKYAGMLRRQANEFKRHFEDAMREAEMDNLRKELEGMRDEFAKSTHAAETAVGDTMKAAEKGVNEARTIAAGPVPVAGVTGTDTEAVALPAPAEMAALPAPVADIAAPQSSVPAPKTGA
jgi:sec-independent protein translocase protein TatB